MIPGRSYMNDEVTSLGGLTLLSSIATVETAMSVPTIKKLARVVNTASKLIDNEQKHLGPVS